MIYIENSSTNPFFNLACEEYCLKTLDLEDDIVMLWRDDNSIIVGKHQNTIEEINGRYVAENNIRVARRITGGGAVYHDLGNLNYTFIVRIDRADMLDMKKYGLSVVKALAKMGITAELSGRNDITIDGRKFSGTAQAVHKNRLLYHGTLLFDSNMEVLSKALNVKLDKIESKGVKSVRSRVTNIKEHLREDYGIMEFKRILLQYLFEGETYKEYVLTDHDIEQIKALEQGKYSTWDWNYGESPRCNLSNSKRFPGGKVEVCMNITDGVIDSCRFYGDFLGSSGVEDVERLLVGKRYDRNEVGSALDTVDLTGYFGNITRDELLSCIFE